MVKNVEGKIAMKHHSTNPSRPIQIGEKVYQAVPQFNISLMWVEETDVEKILNSPEFKTKGCNCGGGVTKPLFTLANELDVSLFLTGDRPH
jgi:hypothetical protein